MCIHDVSPARLQAYSVAASASIGIGTVSEASSFVTTINAAETPMQFISAVLGAISGALGLLGALFPKLEALLARASGTAAPPPAGMVSPVMAPAPGAAAEAEMINNENPIKRREGQTE
jgi:hypothetical protein